MDKNTLDKVVLDAIKFIVDNGGSDYYKELLIDKFNIDYEAEIHDIVNLFNDWIIEFEWDSMKTAFMLNFIELSKIL